MSVATEPHGAGVWKHSDVAIEDIRPKLILKLTFREISFVQNSNINCQIV